MTEEINLIVPLYNESKRFNILEYERFIENTEAAKFIFVNDASSDNTLEILSTFKDKYPGKVEVICNDTNLGKGATIRKGILHALKSNNAKQLAFIDADLSVPLHDLIRFSKTLHSSNATVAFGVRDLSDKSHVKRTFVRKYLSYFFRFYEQRMFQFEINDTQCGAKVFKRGMAEVLYQKPFETRWLSDVELLIRLKKYCTENSIAISQQLLTIPVTFYVDRTGSKLNFFELLRTAYDLVKLSVHNTLSVFKK